ncbi:AGAP008042-PA-like protein [Anopheles sinensis]|uniref:AGAP008042-PA-like protein n=1 Tax=Anopheles sinensis TaxID=74873 RepID=A0A084WGF5_ANOSI|nr:AGAP008042-PA-like protein [Anopheles sinensis]
MLRPCDGSNLVKCFHLSTPSQKLMQEEEEEEKVAGKTVPCGNIDLLLDAIDGRRFSGE